LIAHFSLGHTALSSAESLREIIGLYDFPALVDRQLERSRIRLLEGIESVETVPATRLYRGAPVRGLSVRVRMGEEQVGGEGEMYLLGSILNELFANCVSLNSYSRMEVVGTRFSEVFVWPARIGRRAIL
jgi:type VI secretion system protein ImpG